METFDWGIGDVAACIEIIYGIIRIFDEAKDAKKYYANSTVFIRQLIPILDRLRDDASTMPSRTLVDDFDTLWRLRSFSVQTVLRSFLEEQLRQSDCVAQVRLLGASRASWAGSKIQERGRRRSANVQRFPDPGDFLDNYEGASRSKSHHIGP